MRRNYLLFILLLLFTTGRLAAQVNASFTSSAQFGCPPLVVTFNDQSTGGVTSWHWEFDNGNTSNQQDPVENLPTPVFTMF